MNEKKEMQILNEIWHMGDDGNWIKEVTYTNGHKEIVRYLGTGFDMEKQKIPSHIVGLLIVLGIVILILIIKFMY